MKICWTLVSTLSLLCFCLFFSAQADSGRQESIETLCKTIFKRLQNRDFASRSFADNYVAPLATLSYEIQLKSSLSRKEFLCLNGHYQKIMKHVSTRQTDMEHNEKSGVASAISALGKAMSVYTEPEFELSEVVSSRRRFARFTQSPHVVSAKALYKKMVETNSKAAQTRIIALTSHLEGSAYTSLTGRGSDAIVSLEEDFKKLLDEAPIDRHKNVATLAIRTLIRSVYLFTEWSKTESLERIEKKIAQIKLNLRQKNPFSEAAKTMRAEAEKAKRAQLRIMNQEYGVSSVIKKLESTLSHYPQVPLNLVKVEFEKARLSLQEGFRFGPLLIKEGDSWAQFGLRGLGEFFSRLVRSPSGQTHSGVVMKLEEQGFPIYVTAEVSSTLAKRPIRLRGRTFMRPKFKLPENMSAKVLENAERFDSILFDVMYRPGLQSSEGHAFLYCSELVHYFYKNMLNPNLAPLQSPFDSTNNALVFRTPKAKENLVRLGYDPDSDYFTPGNLVFSPEMKFIGTVFGHYWRKPRSKRSLSSMQMEFAVMGRFFKDLQSGFESRLVRSASALEAIGVDAVLRFGSFVESDMPSWSEKVPLDLEVLLKNVRIDEPKRHATLLFLVSQNRIRQKLNETISMATTDKNPEMHTPIDEVLNRYELELQPKVEAMFE